jgi:hypothetical protein
MRLVGSPRNRPARRAEKRFAREQHEHQAIQQDSAARPRLGSTRSNDWLSACGGLDSAKRLCVCFSREGEQSRAPEARLAQQLDESGQPHVAVGASALSGLPELLADPQGLSPD